MSHHYRLPPGSGPLLSAKHGGVAMKRQRGFTLLEIVIAMTLTALLLGMLSAGLYGVVNDWRNETGGLESGLDEALVVLQLDRALQAAFPHTYIDREQLAQRVYFRGEADSLSFVTTVSPQRQPVMTAWRLRSDPEQGLQLQLTPAFGDDPDTRLDDLDPTPLLPGYRAEFRYLVQRDIDSKDWLDSWDGSARQSLPLAVQVILTPREPGSEPLTVVAPLRAWRSVAVEPVVLPP